MRDRTIFILPDGQELAMQGLVTIPEGREVFLEHPTFGSSGRKVLEISHHLRIEAGILAQTVRLYLS